MSVPLSKRTFSRLEYYDLAVRLRISITNLLLRDFGIKDKIRNLNVLSGMKGMSDEDVKTLEIISDKYGFKHPVLEKYPSWLVDYLRTGILEILRDLIKDITSAYTIHVDNETDYYKRKSYQTKAIIDCEHLLQEFNYIIQVIPCNVKKFVPYTDMIESEISHLKHWRLSDSKLLDSLKKQG